MLNFQRNISLKKYNTFAIDVNADALVCIESIEDLLECASNPEIITKPLMVLGEGSNVLFSSDFHGCILKLLNKNISIIHETESDVLVRVDGGLNWDKLVEWTVMNGYGGLENLSLIPGSVGAAPVQNIGAYGIEVKDSIVELAFFSFEKKKLVDFRNEDCAFDYRDSIFKKELKGKGIIFSVTFSLKKLPHVFNTDYALLRLELSKKEIINIQTIREAIIEIRNSKLPDPSLLPNAGSFFKNPVIAKEHFDNLLKEYPQMPFFEVNEKQMKIPAGWLIEQCGWKGKRIGSVGVHEKQALVIVNYGNASGKDIMNLSEAIRKDVYVKFSVNIEREVNLV